MRGERGVAAHAHFSFPGGAAGGGGERARAVCSRPAAPAPVGREGDLAALAPSRCRLFRQLGSFLLSSPATAARAPYLSGPPLAGGCCRLGFACPQAETAGRAGIPRPSLPAPGLR